MKPKLMHDACGEFDEFDDAAEAYLTALDEKAKGEKPDG